MYVNGPINVARLEGDVNGKQKVLYTFMDVHIPVDSQTKCDNIRAVDVKDYIINNFDRVKN